MVAMVVTAGGQEEPYPVLIDCQYLIHTSSSLTPNLTHSLTHLVMSVSLTLHMMPGATHPFPNSDSGIVPVLHGVVCYHK